MRTRRAGILYCCAAVLCVVAVAAVPASAHQFTASAVKSVFPLTTKGIGVGPQSFKFGKVEIECELETTKGTVTESPTQLLKLEASYRECHVPIVVFGQHTTTTTHFKVEYLYHANGLVQNGNEFETGPEPEVEIGAGGVSMSIAHTGGCKVVWPAQNIPFNAESKQLEEYSSAVFSPEEVAATNLKVFPSGFQKKLVIANEFKGMAYSLEEKGLCSELEKTEGRNGHYSGKVEVEAHSGNLGFE